MTKYILPRDLESLQTKRDELLAELRDIGNEIRSLIEQKLESEQDSGAFDSAVDREKNVNIQLNDLAQILEDTELYDEEFTGESVIIGCRVVCQTGDDLQEYVIVGDWFDEQNYLPYAVLSASSPLGSQLLGKTLGDSFVPAGQSIPWVVISIFPVV